MCDFLEQDILLDEVAARMNPLVSKSKFRQLFLLQ